MMVLRTLWMLVGLIWELDLFALPKGIQMLTLCMLKKLMLEKRSLELSSVVWSNSSRRMRCKIAKLFYFAILSLLKWEVSCTPALDSVIRSWIVWWFWCLMIWKVWFYYSPWVKCTLTIYFELAKSRFPRPLGLEVWTDRQTDALTSALLLPL